MRNIHNSLNYILLESYDSVTAKHFTYFAKFVTPIQRSPTARVHVCVCVCVGLFVIYRCVNDVA